MDIAEFLRARLDDDYRWAYNAQGLLGIETEWHSVDELRERGITRADAHHIARHDPARVLREVEAKRQIIEQAEEATGLDLQVDGEFRIGRRDEEVEPYCGDVILGALASAYADHPDYDPDWA